MIGSIGSVGTGDDFEAIAHVVAAAVGGGCFDWLIFLLGDGLSKYGCKSKEVLKIDLAVLGQVEAFLGGAISSGKKEEIGEIDFAAGVEVGPLTVGEYKACEGWEGKENKEC